MKVNLKKVLSYRPKGWKSTKQNYFSLREVVYLKKLVKFLKDKNFSHDNLLDAWDEMMHIKSSQKEISVQNRVTLPEALALFFETDYHSTKQHYVAYLEAVWRY